MVFESLRQHGEPEQQLIQLYTTTQEAFLQSQTASSSSNFQRFLYELCYNFVFSEEKYAPFGDFLRTHFVKSSTTESILVDIFWILWVEVQTQNNSYSKVRLLLLIKDCQVAEFCSNSLLKERLDNELLEVIYLCLSLQHLLIFFLFNYKACLINFNLFIYFVCVGD